MRDRECQWLPSVLILQKKETARQRLGSCEGSKPESDPGFPVGAQERPPGTHGAAPDGRDAPGPQKSRTGGSLQVKGNLNTYQI